MCTLGRSKPPLPYDVFSLSRSAAEAKRYAKRERIHHRGRGHAIKTARGVARAERFDA